MATTRTKSKKTTRMTLQEAQSKLNEIGENATSKYASDIRSRIAILQSKKPS